jgi:hypothetical protein
MGGEDTMLILGDQTDYATNTCIQGVEKTVDLINATEVPDHYGSDEDKNDEVINLDSQPSNKASPIDLDDGASH